MKIFHPGVPLAIEITLPLWVQQFINEQSLGVTDDDNMRFVIALARENVLQGTGGPFGAAIFQQPGNRLVSVGVNRVEELNNAVLHAEIVALMWAQSDLGSYTLRSPALHSYDLFTSCTPCAMCMGAALWSGVKRIVCGASRDDAISLGFEEGPVFPETYRYLEARDIEILQGLLGDEARDVFELYRNKSGSIYNG